MSRLIRAFVKRPGGPTGCSRKIRIIPRFVSKKLGGYEHVWSVRINEQYRAVGERQGDTVVWVWIGSHNEFDKLFG